MIGERKRPAWVIRAEGRGHRLWGGEVVTPAWRYLFGGEKQLAWDTSQGVVMLGLAVYQAESHQALSCWARQARFTVAVETPNCLAVTSMLEPVSFLQAAIAASSCSFGAPNLRPSALALFMPAI